ncbi:hypothetical protein [Kitasatospora sp. NPDC050543]|uniref:hypothetical protein n=1 Tax=Kitasatospora sp. NPDC050543 TaxID=3364054 RepID=UPI0037B3A0CD
MVSDPIHSNDRTETAAAGQSAMGAVIDALEHAVVSGDPAAFEAAVGPVQQALQGAGPAEAAEAGPRLAGLLGEVPAWPRAFLAVMTGACVERGADPLACAGPILGGTRRALEAALLLTELWKRTGGGELPDPEQDDPGEAMARLGGPASPRAERAVTGWWTVHLWEMAANAVLAHAPVRLSAAAHGVREVLLELASSYGEVGPEMKCLVHSAKTLDDEPLLVLHRPTGTGYRLRMSGLTDTFQLHTLLADVLIGGGHLPGTAPDPEVVAVSRDTDLAPGRRLLTGGSFNLVAMDGTWIWNEGAPIDIPVVDGIRILVLDPPPYERSWPAGRLIPAIAGDLVLERVLPAAEAAALLAKAAPGSQFGQ